MTTQIKGNDTSTFGGNVDLGSNSLTQNNLTGFTAKAWVYFNGTGTVAIRDSGNVSSITDVANGTYTISFTTAMPDINFAVAAFSGRNANPDVAGNANGRGTTYLNITTGSHTGAGAFTVADVDSVNITIFR